MTTDGKDLTGVKKKVELPEEVKAPIRSGEVAGKAIYTLDGKTIGSVDILYDKDVAAAGYRDYFYRTLAYFTPL